MEIREHDKSILMEKEPDGTLYMEWCDGLTRGVRMLKDTGFYEKVKDMLKAVLKTETVQSVYAEGGNAYVKVEHGSGYFRVEIGYVPEEDLMPWQWMRAADYFRLADYEALLKEI